MSIKLLLPSLMTETSFWASEQWLLTSNWTKMLSLMSPMRRIYCFPETRPKSLLFTWRKGGETEGEFLGALWRFGGEWVNHHIYQFLLVNMQSLENKLDLRWRLSSQWNIRKRNILGLTESWLNDTDNIELGWVFCASAGQRSWGIAHLW